MPITITCDKCGCNVLEAGFKRCRECDKVFCAACASRAGVQKAQGFWATLAGSLVGACPFCKSDNLKTIDY